MPISAMIYFMLKVLLILTKDHMQNRAVSGNVMALLAIVTEGSIADSP